MSLTTSQKENIRTMLLVSNKHGILISCHSLGTSKYSLSVRSVFFSFRICNCFMFRSNLISFSLN